MDISPFGLGLKSQCIDIGPDILRCTFIELKYDSESIRILICLSLLIPTLACHIALLYHVEELEVFNVTDFVVINRYKDIGIGKDKVLAGFILYKFERESIIYGIIDLAEQSIELGRTHELLFLHLNFSIVLIRERNVNRAFASPDSALEAVLVDLICDRCGDQVHKTPFIGDPGLGKVLVIICCYDRHLAFHLTRRSNAVIGEFLEITVS